MKRVYSVLIAEDESEIRRAPEELAAFLREASRPELTVLVKTPETAKPHCA